jgi:hypothetical protein
MSAATAVKTLNIAKLDAARLMSEPFPYLLVEDFLHEDCKREILRDFPPIDRNGSFPLFTLKPGPAFTQLADELLDKEFEIAVGRKFEMDLSRYPTMITVRGRCNGATDGRIHTDSKDKIITVLLYLNPTWEDSGGRLRVLRSKSLEDYVAEVPPAMGNLLIFQRCDHSFHGHLPFDGKRMSLQMNWVKSERYLRREQLRHQISSWVKRFTGRG